MKTVLIVFNISLGLILFSFKIGQKTNSDIHPDMIKITGGSFIIGQDDGEGDERPEHEVIINDFLIGKYEVSVEEYRAFCFATNREMPSEPEWSWLDNHPIINTSWNDANSYITWLNHKMNERYRLPTEAEFEYVIRNGGEPGKYPWGKGMPIDENLADESFKKETSRNRIWKDYNDGFAYTAPVGSFNPNKLGVYDINGNIWEWCSDWYGDYSDNMRVNPKGPNKGTSKVGRGASFDADPWHSRSASRAFVEPTFQRPGFRLAKDVD